MNNYTPQDEFLARWLSGELTQEELNEWKKHPDYQELRAIVDNSSDWKVPQNLTKEEAWQKLRKKVDFSQGNDKPSVVFPKRRLLFAGIAAALALLAGIYFFYPSQAVVKKSLAGQTLTFDLPDGSNVMLNANSELAFYPDQWGKKREVSLKGEAFFQVAHGSRFTVQTQKGEVAVLGTSFNVKDRKSQFEVQCFTGKVQVAVSRQQAVEILHPQTGVRMYENGQLTLFDFPSTQTADWVEGRFSFKNRDFNLVIEELERQFDVEISMNGNSDKAFTGTFFTGDLNEALKAVCEPFGLVWETDESTGQIILQKK